MHNSVLSPLTVGIRLEKLIVEAGQSYGNLISVRGPHGFCLKGSSFGKDYIPLNSDGIPIGNPPKLYE